MSETPGQDLSTTLRKTRDEDRKKGKAVLKQFALYDALLDARIRLQKCVTLANRLGLSTSLPENASFSPKFVQCTIKLVKEGLLLSGTIYDLQELLLATNESVTLPPRKKHKPSKPIDDTIESLDTAVKEATADFSAVEQIIHPYALRTLQKWSSKILAISPSLLASSSANRPMFSSVASHKPKGAVQLIDEVLADLDKLRARTQVLRSKTPAAGGGAEVQGEDGGGREVFDDTDFYQSLLRDVIAARADGGAGEADWMTEQRRRKKEKKKNLDTKASKGRKIRYQVHEKLQNFMVPVPVVHGGWHEEQIDELFASLLGRGFEGSGPVQDHDEDLGTGDVVQEATMDGFKIFG